MKKFVSEVSSLLKPGGYFCITDFRYRDTDDETKKNNIR